MTGHTQGLRTSRLPAGATVAFLTHALLVPLVAALLQAGLWRLREIDARYAAAEVDTPFWCVLAARTLLWPVLTLAELVPDSLAGSRNLTALVWSDGFVASSIVAAVFWTSLLYVAVWIALRVVRRLGSEDRTRDHRIPQE